MVTIRELLKEDPDTLKIIFGFRFYLQVKAGIVRDERHIIPPENPLEFIEQFSDELSQFYVRVRLIQYFRKRNIISDDEAEKLLILKDKMQSALYDYYSSIFKQFPKEDWGVLNDQIRWATDSAKLKALSRFTQKKEKLDRLLLTCEFPGCGRVYLAKRSHSHFCDDHRMKGNVYKNRAKKRISLAPQNCEYSGCKNMFTPKTTRARFCSDVCRVRAGRDKNN